MLYNCTHMATVGAKGLNWIWLDLKAYHYRAVQGAASHADEQ